VIFAFTDGEMSNLSADFGQLLCACVVEYAADRPTGVNLRTFALGDYDKRRWDDRSLAVAWRDALEEYDVIVTWNGIRFDLPFLNTRLRRWGLRELRSPKHRDLMFTARYKLRLSNAKMDTVAQFLKCKVHKTPMQPEQWTMAMGGHHPSYRYIIRHCQNDVKVLAEAWAKMKHLVGEIKVLLLSFGAAWLTGAA
jgi:uncharacterized protein YprB with RNaseH-like and TPR domain